MPRLFLFSILLITLVFLSGCTTWRNVQGDAITLEDEADCEQQCSYQSKGLTGSSIAMCVESCKRYKGFEPTRDE